MAAPTDESIFQLLTPKEAVCARPLVRYIARKRHIAADSAAELQAARLSTKDEQRLAEDAIIQRPWPHSVGDMLLLMGAIVANQPTLARRAFYAWLLYCVVLPLYIWGRWEVYLERLWWNYVLLWRIWKLVWKREVQIWWLVCTSCRKRQSRS